MKKVLLFLGLYLASLSLTAQSVVKYTYDNAGNRINRQGATVTTAAQWTFTGNTRCAVNSNNVNNGNIEREEKDNNSSSSSYNQVRWVLSGYSTSTCPLPPNWVNTGNWRCQVDGSYNNTGNVETEQIDNNPGSATYNQTQWYLDYYDTYSCPLPSSCTYSTCEANGPEYRCVYGFCETGYKVYTDSYYDYGYGMYRCTYHYEWSDGAQSVYYEELNYNPCFY